MKTHMRTFNSQESYSYAQEDNWLFFKVLLCVYKHCWTLKIFNSYFSSVPRCEQRASHMPPAQPPWDLCVLYFPNIEKCWSNLMLSKFRMYILGIFNWSLISHIYWVSVTKKFKYFFITSAFHIPRIAAIRRGSIYQIFPLYLCLSLSCYTH